MVRRTQRRDLASRALRAGAQVVAPDADRRSIIAAGRSLVGEGRGWTRSRSIWSVGSAWSAGSAYSAFSAGSAVSVGAAASILSIGSVGSILSIGSAGSILSIGSVASVGGVGSLARNNIDTTALRIVTTASTALAVAALVGGLRRD